MKTKIQNSVSPVSIGDHISNSIDYIVKTFEFNYYAPPPNSSTNDVDKGLDALRIVVEEGDEAIVAAGTVDDTCTLSVGREVKTSSGGAAHSFRLEVRPEPGRHQLSFTHHNIEYYPMPVGNASVLSGSLGPVRVLLPKEDSAMEEMCEPCGDDQSGGVATSSGALSTSDTVLLQQFLPFVSSSGGRAINREATSQYMRWSCGFGTFRGIGGIPQGRLELAAQNYSDLLLTPNALSYSHAFASVLSLPAGGLANNTVFRLYQGAVYRNYSVNADGSGAFHCGTHVATSEEIDFVSGFAIDESVVTSLSEAAYVRVKNGEGGTFYDMANGRFAACIAPSGNIITATEAERYLTIVREETLDSIRQIWSLWDGLIDIEQLGGNGGFSISFYLSSQVSGMNMHTGLYEVAEGAEPFRIVTVTGDFSLSRLTVHEHDSSLPATIPQYVCSWMYSDGGWSISVGEGDDALVEERVREEISTSDHRYRIIITTKRGDDIASCTAEEYVDDWLCGPLLTKRIEGYGSIVVQETRYEYSTNGKIVKKVKPDGGVYEYRYDALGRLRLASSPWAGGRNRFKAYTYVDGGGALANEVKEVKTCVQDADGTAIRLRTDSYTYFISDDIKRVEKRSTGGAGNVVQLMVTETWRGTVPSIFSRGRIRMSQAVDGVQTWHDYTASSLHGELYAHTMETRVAGAAVPGKSTRTVVYVTAEGNTVREEKYAMLVDGSWSLIDGLSHTYDVQNRRIATLHDNGRISSCGLTCTGALLWEINEDGVRTDYAYNTARQLVEMTRSKTSATPETITEYVKDAAGRTRATVTRTGAMETVERMEYDVAGRMVKMTDVLDRDASFAYSEDGLTTTMIAPSGATFITRRNADGSISEQSGTGQRHLIHVYDINGDNLRHTIRLGNNNAILGQEITNAFGQVVTITAPTSIENAYRYTRHEYNALGQLTKRREQGGGQYAADTLFTYDEMGDQVKEILVLDSSNPDSDTENRVVERYSHFSELASGVHQVTANRRYNASGTLLQSTTSRLVSKLSSTLESLVIKTDERGAVSTARTVYGSSLEERVRSMESPCSDIIAIETVADGFVTSGIDHRGGSTSYTRAYTSTGQIRTETDPRGNMTTTRTDLAGRVVHVTNSAGRVMATEYDPFHNKPFMITDATRMTTCYRYDARGRKIMEYGTALPPSVFTYDAADRMTSLTVFRADAGGIKTDLGERTDGDTTEWIYHDATGLQLTKTYADGRQEAYAYDAFNRVLTLTDARGIVTTNNYQLSTGKLLSVRYSDGTMGKTYRYNVLGQVTSVTDASGTRQFTYTRYGEMENDCMAAFGTTFTVHEIYDGFGRSLGYSLQREENAMLISSIGYDDQGRIGMAGFLHGDSAKEFTYSYVAGTNLISTLAHPNNITTVTSYETSRDLINSIVDNRGTTGVALRNYVHDVLGRPATRSYARQGTTRHDAFFYNERSELTEATSGNDSYAYRYDNMGNRITAQEAANSIAYTTNCLNQYSGIVKNGGVPFDPEFDAAGNQTSVQTSTGEWIIVYNAENRPVSFTSSDGKTVMECIYDYMGRRSVKKVTVDGRVTLHHGYLYRGYLQIACIDLTRPALNCLWMITWNPAERIATRPLAIQVSGTWFTYGHDLTKNITELYKTDGTIANAYTYTPFGGVTVSGSTVNPFRWSSEFYDTELGLSYYNYRYYNALDGRWINREPIGERGGFNLYGFVGNQVTRGWDYIGCYTLIDATETVQYSHHDEFTFSHGVSEDYKGEIGACPECGCVLIWVHGYNVTLKKAQENFNEVKTNYRSAGGQCKIYGFAWNGDSGALNFSAAKEVSRLTGANAFSKFIRDLKTKCPDTRIHIGSHSLGAGVVLQALAHGKGVRGIGNVILTNAAVDNEVLEPDEEFEKAPRFAQSICVAISQEDDVLERAYRVSEFNVALGENGPDDPTDVPPNVYVSDFTRDFGDGHSAVYDEDQSENYWHFAAQVFH